MAVRPIDANAMLSELRPVSFEAEHSAVLLSDVSKMMREWVERQPTLTPPNEPLSIEQLRKMDGEPVYDYLGQVWYVIQEYYDHELTMTDGTRFFDDDEIDGVDKRFYRRPQEGEEGDANRG